MRALCAAVILISGCAYPDFDFEDASTDASVEETTEEDTSIDTAFDEEDSTVDVVDSSFDTARDSVVMDSAKPDTAPIKGCSTGGHLFCDEFDKSTKIEDPWDGIGLAAGGTVGYETSLFSTSPRAFVAKIVDTSATVAMANLGKTFTVTSTSQVSRFEADVYVEEATHPHSIVLFKIQTPGTGRGVGVNIGPSGYFVEVLGTAYKTFPLPTPPLSKWMHLRMDVVLQKVGGSFSLSVDGSKVASASGISTLDVDGTSRQLSLGIYTNEPPITGFVLRYDDVSFDNL